jgi:anti-sigma B factor antagonist
MTLEERIIGDVTVVSVKGDITLNKGGDLLLKDKVQSLLQQGRRKLVLNLSDVSYVDSAGLGQLVQAHSTAANLGGTLKLANVEKRLRDLLVVTKLVTVFESHDSEAAAVDSFAQAGV